jgi:hypothetical protein
MVIKSKRRHAAKVLERGKKATGNSRRQARGLSNDELRKFAGKHKPPQSWYDKDEELSSAE